MSPATCRSCGKPVVWMVTKLEKSIPVEPYSLSPDDRALLEEQPSKGKLVFDSKRHISHFARCPNAKTHRKKKS